MRNEDYLRTHPEVEVLISGFLRLDQEIRLVALIRLL